MDDPDNAMTKDLVQGRATGALFFVGFGAVWVATGCAQTHHASAGSLVALVAAGVCLLAWIAYLMRRSQDLPDPQRPDEERVRAERMFTAVNIIQWVSVATAVAILSLLHMPEYIVPAISIIVGLHLFPLAGSFGNRLHYVTGALLVAAPLGCLALLPPSHVSGVCAMVVGSVLLLSAAATLARVTAMLPARELNAMNANVTQGPL